MQLQLLQVVTQLQRIIEVAAAFITRKAAPPAPKTGAYLLAITPG
jgi:hypothetical protein